MRRSPLSRGESRLRRVTRLRPRARNPKRRAREEATPEAKAFKAFVTSLPCAACGEQWVAESHHAGAHGLGERSHWGTQTPCCRDCHAAIHLMKGRYADRDRTNTWEAMVVADVNALWLEWQRHRADGTFSLSMEALLRFSTSMAWLKKGAK